MDGVIDFGGLTGVRVVFRWWWPARMLGSFLEYNFTTHTYSFLCNVTVVFVCNLWFVIWESVFHIMFIGKHVIFWLDSITTCPCYHYGPCAVYPGGVYSEWPQINLERSRSNKVCWQTNSAIRCADKHSSPCKAWLSSMTLPLLSTCIEKHHCRLVLPSLCCSSYLRGSPIKNRCSKSR